MTEVESDSLGVGGRLFWGAVGGLLPFGVRVIQQGGNDMSASLPAIGSFFIIAVLVAILLGMIASYAFRAHNVLAALYHGATAPIALAFVSGVGTH